MEVEKVNIGCKLPHGLALEIGIDKKGTPGEGYQCVVLQGLIKARTGSKFGVTSVPKAVWDKWLAKNTKLRYIVDGSVFVVK